MKIDIFADKSSLVLRALLKEPRSSWVIDTSAEATGVSRALVGRVALFLREGGFLRGIERGRNASFMLRNAEELLKNWTQVYSFQKNEVDALYSHDIKILPKLKRWARDTACSYALSLHTGANLRTRFVNDPNVYMYIPVDNFKDTVQKLRADLGLHKLKSGGNFFVIKPYYRHSVFCNLQKLNGYNVVSNLQLYLDLYRFPQRGLEHAEYLKRTLVEKGMSIV